MFMEIKIRSKLISSENNYEVLSVGTINKNIISYVDNDVLVQIDLSDNIMKRTSDDYELILNFFKGKETSSILNMKGLGQNIDMKLYTIDIIKSEGYYFVNYELNDDELFKFELVYEEE